MRPQPSHLHYINQPIHGGLRSLQHPARQHEIDVDADTPVQAAIAPSGPSPESKGPQMANAGPHSWSGSGQGLIQGNVRLGDRAGFDTGPSKTQSTGPNDPTTFGGENHPTRQEPFRGTPDQSMGFQDQNAHLVPLSGLDSLAVGSLDDATFLLSSSTPPRAGAPPLPLLSTDKQIESEEYKGPAGILTLPLELRKKIFGHLLIADMITAEEAATTVLPGKDFSPSLGIHTEILRANRQIHVEAMDVLYGANDWLLVCVEDENALRETFKHLDTPQRRAIKASRRLAPFMEVKISVASDYRGNRNKRRLGFLPSKNPDLKFILDLASFQRLCIQRIHAMEIFRDRTHLQAWHTSYRPDEPKQTARSRRQVELMIGRMDGKGVTRWSRSRSGDDPPCVTREAIAYITGAPSIHEARPQAPHHILEHVDIIARSAGKSAVKNDDRGVRFHALECLRYVHAATPDWRRRNPHDCVPSLRDMFSHIARTTTPLVLRGIEITIAMGNTAQAHDAAGLLQDVLWNHSWSSRVVPQLLNMTSHELACVSFLQAKAYQRENHEWAVVSEMITLFTRWSPHMTAFDTARQWREFFLEEAPHVLRVVEMKRSEIERYNFQVNYRPMLELSVEQFLGMERSEKEKWVEGLLIHALDFRLHNWLFSEHQIHAVGPCWVWPWSEAWQEK